MKFHPTADIFPLMRGPEFDGLVEDIRVNGLRESIWVYQGLIIDGRNRYRACQECRVVPVYVKYEGLESELIPFVVSLNLHRRHLNESQRAMVASRIADLELGGNQHDEGVSIDTASEMLNVGRTSVARARKVQDQGAPELVEAVESGAVSVNAAKDVATLPENEQQEIVARGEREILLAAKEIRAKKADARTKERLDNIAEISRGNVALGTEKKYPIIYADPPWRYENPPMGGSNRSIENQYPTMTLEEICALPVGDLANDDALLYLWATAPKLAECMQVIRAWGFEYRTCMVWVKDKIGMGYHARNQHELLLIAKRGTIPPPPVDARVSSVVNATRGAHSAKPPEFYKIIERAYPNLPKIELFARQQRKVGLWSAWGNQAEGA